MNITFLIGNGFDLSLGMKTRFIDMYSEYIETPSKNYNIQMFKEKLAEDASMHYKNWSDFEMGMATYSQGLRNEEQLIECVRDFKIFMVDFLKRENDKKFNQISSGFTNDFVSEFRKSIKNFYLGLPTNDIRNLKNLINSNSRIGYSFLTFNYTSVLDEFVSSLSSSINETHYFSTPIHVHGSIGEGVLLGIDNVEQLNFLAPTLTAKGKRAFIKPYFNQVHNEDRVNMAINTIEKSNIICSYGLSLGDSDETWRNLIRNWLLNDINHHFVFYSYEERQYDSCNPDEMYDVEEERKTELLQKMGFSETEMDVVFNQLHIPIGYDIFNFINILHDKNISTEMFINVSEREKVIQ